MWRVLVALAALAGLYLLFVWQTSGDELGFGALCAAIAAGWGTVVLRTAAKTLRFEAAAITEALRAVASVPERTARVGVLLARATLGGQIGGTIKVRTFVRGREADAADAGRRAAVVLALSLAPDSFVVSLPAERNEIDLHQLVPSPERGDARWPS